MLFKSLGAAAVAASSLLWPASTTTQSGPPNGGISVDSAQKILRSVIRGRSTTTVNTSGRTSSRGSRSAHIPPGQLPPAGMCRVWIDGVPPGQQPAPTDCQTAVATKPANARVIFGGDGTSFPGKGNGKFKKKSGTGNRDLGTGKGRDRDDDERKIRGRDDDDDREEFDRDRGENRKHGKSLAKRGRKG